MTDPDYVSGLKRELEEANLEIDSLNDQIGKLNKQVKEMGFALGLCRGTMKQLENENTALNHFVDGTTVGTLRKQLDNKDHWIKKAIEECRHTISESRSWQVKRLARCIILELKGFDTSIGYKKEDAEKVLGSSD